jgi:hypothetical protein
MQLVTQAQLADYRGQTFRWQLALRLQTLAEAIEFVQARGLVYFWPIKGVTFPNLWTAVAGDRPVANEHDDPGHVTWGWKDQMLGQPGWYYAKILRGKATMIAPDIVPYFYALSQNYGEPEHDYLQSYADGLLTREAKMVYEVLLREGKLDTIRLRREAHLASKSGKSPFDRALVALQRDFKILPIGVSEAGAWRYSHVYDCVHHVYPDLPQQARAITRREAQAKLMTLYFEAMGAATTAEFRYLFQWQTADIKHTVQQLIENQTLVPVQIENQSGEAFARFVDA